MAETSNYIAVDLGAEGGRVILSLITDGSLNLKGAAQKGIPCESVSLKNAMALQSRRWGLRNCVYSGATAGQRLNVSDMRNSLSTESKRLPVGGSEKSPA